MDFILILFWVGIGIPLGVVALYWFSGEPLDNADMVFGMIMGAVGGPVMVLPAIIWAFCFYVLDTKRHE